MERLLQRDLVLRLLSLVLAVVLFIVVYGEPGSKGEKSFSAVPLTAELPDDMRIVSGSIPATVDVELKGTPLQLGRSRVTSAVVDFTGQSTNTTVQVPVAVPGLPKGVEATVRPAFVPVVLERLTSSEVPVQVRADDREQLIGDIRYALQVTDLRVRAGGPESLVNRVAAVWVEPDLSGVNESGIKIMPLLAVDATGRVVGGVTLEPDNVQVHVDVQPLPPAKTVRVRPIFMGTPPKGYTYTASVEPATVKVRGARQYHAQWAEILTNAISLTDQTQSFTLQAVLVKPPGAESLDAETVSVRVTIQETRVDEVFEQVPVQIWNLAGNLEAQLSLPAVSVQVRGFRRALDQLDPATLAPHVDVTDMGPGTYQLPVVTVRPEGIEVLGALPNVVEIMIQEKPTPPEPEPTPETSPEAGRGAIP